VEGFMKYAVEMSSGAMMWIPSAIVIGSGIQKLIEEGYIDNMMIKKAHFYFFKVRKVG
jgi:hypothetical protein